MAKRQRVEFSSEERKKHEAELMQALATETDNDKYALLPPDAEPHIYHLRRMPETEEQAAARGSPGIPGQTSMICNGGKCWVTPQRIAQVLGPNWNNTPQWKALNVVVKSKAPPMRINGRLFTPGSKAFSMIHHHSRFPGKLFGVPKFWAFSMFGYPDKDTRTLGNPMPHRIELRGKQLFPYQRDVVERTVKQVRDIGGGFVRAACSTGKTLMGSEIMARLECENLVVAPPKLLDNWESELTEEFVVVADIDKEPTYLTPLPNEDDSNKKKRKPRKRKLTAKQQADAAAGIRRPKIFVWRGNSGKNALPSPHEHYDVVLVSLQTLSSAVSGKKLPPGFLKRFGTVVIDECHGMAAQSYYKLVELFSARHLIGLTATPERKDGLGYLLFWLMGPLVRTVSHNVLHSNPLTVEETMPIAMEVVDMPEYELPDCEDSFAKRRQALTQVRARNNVIGDCMREALLAGCKRIYCSTTRLDHIPTLLEQARSVMAALYKEKHPDVYPHFLACQKQQRELQEENTSCQEDDRIPFLEPAVLKGGWTKANLELSRCSPITICMEQAVGVGFNERNFDCLLTAMHPQDDIQLLGRVQRRFPGKHHAIMYYLNDKNTFGFKGKYRTAHKAFYKHQHTITITNRSISDLCSEAALRRLKQHALPVEKDG